ncbi:MAG: AAA family ATPase [Rhodobacteraceae bacterium]|nr:AAA family ATPase [Paracoccaceae bacterium]MCY4326902.1 AAA family ATPase [Paracoccaceae bacterium]
MTNPDLTPLIAAYRAAEAITDQAAQQQARGDAARALYDALPPGMVEGGMLDAALNALEQTPDDPELQAAFRAAFDAEMPPAPLPVQTWERTPPARRDWLIPGWIPRGRLTSLYGAGGAGKSRLALQLAASLMHGGSPLAITPGTSDADLADLRSSGMGKMQEGGLRVLWLSWEDETAEFLRRWRMAWQAGAVTVEYPDPARLSLVDMREIGGPLWAPEGNGHISNRATWTAAGMRFLSSLKGHALAVVDPLAAAFASSENDRALVRQFAATIDGAAETANCTVLLIGHPPKAIAAGYSGSTDWRNAVRAMLALETSPETGYLLDADEGSEKAAAWRLRLDKSSYAHEGEQVWLTRHYQDTAGADQDEPALAWRASTARDAAQAHNPGEVLTRTGGGLETAPRPPPETPDRPETPAPVPAARDEGAGEEVRATDFDEGDEFRGIEEVIGWENL